jgi:hypothetical protein
MHLLPKHNLLKSNSALRIAIIGVIASLIPGCGVKQDTDLRSVVYSRDVHVYRAKWSDVPFPLDVESRFEHQVTSLFDRNGLGGLFTYKAALSFEDAKKFYHTQLEREGWIESARVDIDESSQPQALFVSVKSTRMVVVKLQALSSSQTAVEIVVSAKK